MSMRSCGKQLALRLCSMHGSVVMPKKTTCEVKLPSCDPVIPAQSSSKTSVAVSPGSGKALSPYWNAFTAEKSCGLWLPTKTALQDLALNLLSGWQSKTGARSWFSTRQSVAQNKNLHRIFYPFWIRSLAGCPASASTVTKSRKIRIYPNADQRAKFRHWMVATRWWYNEAVSLYRAGFSLSEYEMRRVVRAVSPFWFADVPSKILCGAISDAHKANQAVRRKRKAFKEKGIKRKVLLHFRSRKAPVQSLYLCHVAWNKDLTTFYPQSLGKVRLSEPLSVVPKDGRLVSYNGRHYVTVPHASPQHVAENQGRVVALDPGIRSFLTFFSETDCGKIGDGDFGKKSVCVFILTG